MHGIPIQKTDTLWISAWATIHGIDLNVVLDIRRPTGERLRTTYTYTPTGDISENIFFVPLSDGELLSCVVYTQNQYILRGQCYVRAVIHQGAVWQRQPHVVLFADYVTSAAPLSFPGYHVRSAIEERGYVRMVMKSLDASYTVADIVVPAGLVWVSRVIRYDVVISDAAGDRIPLAMILDEAENVFYLASTRVPFSSPGTYSVSISTSPVTEFASATVHNIPVPADIRMYPYWTIRLDIQGAQAGDYIANMQYSVEEWIYI